MRSSQWREYQRLELLPPAKPAINSLPRTLRSRLGSVLGSLGQAWLKRLSTPPELRVWQRRDRAGRIIWKAYDPRSGQSTSSASEAEMRLWIEQHYYLPQTR